MEKETDKLIELIDHQKNVVNILNEVSSKVNASLDLDTVFKSVFQLLDSFFNFKHTMILLIDTDNELKVHAMHGYDGEGVGAIVPTGKGVIGIVAKNKRLLRMNNIQGNLRYLHTVVAENLTEVKLPGIDNCASQLAVPLLFHSELVGVISIESPNLALFNKKDEELLQMIGVQVAIAINNAKQFDIIENTNAQLKDLNENLEEKVIERTRELAEQKDLVEEKNREVMDSIRYALRIQNSLLPTTKTLDKNLQQYFIIFKPKDIVSGDFYWLNRQGNKVFYACVDCTGHGVPGAFVSMIGSIGLRRAVIELGLKTPAEILESLNEFIQHAINTSGKIKDGMDMALCCIDYDKNVLEFSGAHNGALICRNNELIELAANKQPVGSFEHRTSFTNHVFNLEKGDRIYTTTDGYVDQFGGPKGKKFMKKRYKALILDNQHLSMQEQGDLFNVTMNDWIGKIDQIDDICVIGVEFTQLS